MKIRKHLESLPPYTPIEPFEVLSERIGRAPTEIVKLDANETHTDRCRLCAQH